MEWSEQELNDALDIARSGGVQWRVIAAALNEKHPNRKVPFTASQVDRKVRQAWAAQGANIRVVVGHEHLSYLEDQAHRRGYKNVDIMVNELFTILCKDRMIPAIFD